MSFSSGFFCCFFCPTQSLLHRNLDVIFWDSLSGFREWEREKKKKRNTTTRPRVSLLVEEKTTGCLIRYQRSQSTRGPAPLPEGNVFNMSARVARLGRIFPVQSGNPGCSALQPGLPDWGGEICLNLATPCERSSQRRRIDGGDPPVCWGWPLRRPSWLTLKTFAIIHTPFEFFHDISLKRSLSHNCLNLISKHITSADVGLWDIKKLMTTGKFTLERLTYRNWVCLLTVINPQVIESPLDPFFKQ